MHGLEELVASLSVISVYLYIFQESGAILTSIWRPASWDLNCLMALEPVGQIWVLKLDDYPKVQTPNYYEMSLKLNVIWFMNCDLLNAMIESLER